MKYPKIINLSQYEYMYNQNENLKERIKEYVDPENLLDWDNSHKGESFLRGFYPNKEPATLIAIGFYSIDVFWELNGSYLANDNYIRHIEIDDKNNLLIINEPILPISNTPNLFLNQEERDKVDYDGHYRLSEALNK